jgi:hypothetical protein
MLYNHLFIFFNIELMQFFYVFIFICIRGDFCLNMTIKDYHFVKLKLNRVY